MTDTIVYIAGRYSGDTVGNTAKAKTAMEELLGAGYVVFCPHTNFAHTGVIKHSEILECCLKLLQRCADCLLMLEGWQESAGAKIEKKFAEDLGLKVFYSIEELKAFYNAKVWSEL